MAQNQTEGTPSPEEMQKRLSEFMKQFSAIGIAPLAQSEPSGDSSESAKTAGEEFNFSLKPRDIKAYLDRFVIRQEEAKKVLSVALCDHYHHVRLAKEGKEPVNYTKQNIILLGPTGVGKTYLIRSIADLIGVPFVKGDATKFSETGYVGGDVEDLVRELARRADGDVERAEYGMIYIDEIDKLAAASNQLGRDVSGRGVQTNLLKLMEETEVPARSPQDLAGQVQALMEAQRGRKSKAVINTKHILFIVSGAFEGLDKITRRRMREATIGFSAKNGPVEAHEALESAQTRDFIEFGFEPEFIGRLPVRVVCHPLSVEDMFQILKSSEGSIIRQYAQSFSSYGIQAEFTDDGLRRIADLAAEEQTGARGLMTVCERIFRDFKFELPSTAIRALRVTKELVENPAASLAQLLATSRDLARDQSRNEALEFAREFQRAYGLRIRFTDAAIEWLVRAAAEKQQPVSRYCEEKFKDFHFGLKLIAHPDSAEEYVLDEEAVKDPDKHLSERVLASYRPGAVEK